MNMNRFTTKRVSQKRDSDFSFVNERREQTRSSGFTLIETMVAIAILTLAVAGPLYTANRAIVAAQTANAQMTASYLAQEGIEYMRMVRDDAYLANYTAGGASISASAWNGSVPPLGFLTEIAPCAATACTLDPLQTLGVGTGDSLVPLVGTPPFYNASPLYLTNCTNGSGGLSCSLSLPSIYTQQNLPGSVQTAFTRTIQAVAVSPTDERIISTVAWSFHSIPYAVTITDHFTPWQ